MIEQIPANIQNNTWDSLALDVYSLILRNTDVPSLFRVRALNQRSRQAVSQFLQTVSPATLLRFLPCFDGAFADRLNSPEWHQARNQVLALQLLIYTLNAAPRWQAFNTVESGIVATMLCPLQQLSADRLLAIVGNQELIMPSDTLNHEIDRLTLRYGAERLQALTERFETFYRGLETPGNAVVRIQHQAQYQILAAIVLRACADEHLQDLLVDCLCCQENQFTRALQQLQHHIAADANHLDELLHWIIEPSSNTQEAVEAALGTQDLTLIIGMMQRFLYSVFHANWYHGAYTNALETIKNNPHFQLILYNIRRSGYTQMCCTLLYDSWEKGQKLFKTLTTHVSLVTSIPGHDSRINVRLFSNFSFTTRQKGPLWGEYTFMLGTNYAGSEDRANRIRRFKHDRPNSSDDKFHYLQRDERIICTLESSHIDRSDFSCQYFDTAESKNMAIRETQFNETIFLRGQFDHVRLINNSFTQCEFISCRFNRCLFEGNNFTKANFSVYVDTPTMFTFCQLASSCFENASGMQHVRYIDCEFLGNARPNPAFVYTSQSQNNQCYEFYQELFLQAVKKRDMVMIKWIQSSLFSFMHDQSSVYDQATETLYYDVTPQQDQICREVFGYQPDTLPWLANTLSLGWIEATTSQYSSYAEHVRVIEQAVPEAGPQPEPEPELEPHHRHQL